MGNSRIISNPCGKMTGNRKNMCCPKVEVTRVEICCISSVDEANIAINNGAWALDSVVTR